MQLINNALEILRILSDEKEGMSVTDIADRINIPKSSAHRLLKSLKENNFIIQLDDSKKYSISYKLLSLTNNITESQGLTNSAKIPMRNLADTMNKTIALNVMEGDSIVCIHFEESKDTPMFMIRRGFEMPLHATSAGKVFLAFMNKEKAEDVFSRNKSNKMTERTITDINTLLDELRDVRKNGFAKSDEELQIGVEGVACPIFDYYGKVIASVSFTTLKTDKFVTDENVNMLIKCANTITSNLGGRMNI